MSRQVFLLGIGVALIALALSTTDHLLGLRPGVNEANVKRIRPGMAVWEVEAILGEPRRLQTEPAIGWAWEGRTGVAVVMFDEKDRVMEALFVPPRNAPRGFWRRVGSWLGW